MTIHMQKTKQIVHNLISHEAYGLLGERHKGLIFDKFKNKVVLGPLKRWLPAAGITQKIAFIAHTTFVRKPTRENRYGYSYHPSLSGTQEHYPPPQILFKNGYAADV